MLKSNHTIFSRFSHQNFVYLALLIPPAFEMTLLAYFMFLQALEGLKWSTLCEADRVMAMCAISDIISRNFDDLSIQLEMAINILLQIWRSGVPAVQLTGAQKLLLIAKIGRVILVPGQAFWLKPFMDWLIFCDVTEGAIQIPL